jgi:hypothetical protein
MTFNLNEWFEQKINNNFNKKKKKKKKKKKNIYDIHTNITTIMTYDLNQLNLKSATIL